MYRGNAARSGWSGAVGQGGQQLWQWTARSIGGSSGHQGQPDAAAQGTESIRAECDGQLHATRSVDIFIVGSLVRFTLTVLMTLFKRLLKIGRASCRERVCQYGEISVVDVSL